MDKTSDRALTTRMSTVTPLRELSLEDRYTAVSGPILLDGMQALVRLMLDQRWLDARRGYDTGVFVSGYPGSPLGGLDLELQRAARHLDAAGIVFRPGPQRGARGDRGRRARSCSASCRARPSRA